MTATTELDRLEDISLWYHYKKAVWNTKTPQANTVHNIMRVIRALRTREMVYLSVPITSGKFLYDLLLENPGMDRTQAIPTAIQHNYAAGYELTRELSRAGRPVPLLYPADLTPIHEQWEQVHFQALWLSLIAEKCTAVYMMDGWEYSNGGCEEFTHVMQLRLGLPKSTLELFFINTIGDEKQERQRMRSIGVLDQEGSPITLATGLNRVEQAYAWITGHGFQAPKIAHCIELLKITQSLADAGFYQ